MIHIKSINVSIWKVIKERYQPSSRHEGIRVILKPKGDWTKEDYKEEVTHAKDINVIMYAVRPSEFKKTSKCIIVKVMWDKLDVMYEGTKQVKEIRINMLVHEYEIF